MHLFFCGKILYMARKISFANHELYHVFNRGVEKRNIFIDEIDYKKFVFILFKFNRIQPVRSSGRDFEISLKENSIKKPRTHQPLVKIHHYCLMSNHYHLVLEQVSEGGISKFLQKVMTGYTMYFNKRHERSGVLFQGKTKSKHIDSDPYLVRIRSYIALNPLDIKYSKWKEKGIKNKKEAVDFLTSYKWISKFEYKDILKMVVWAQELYALRSDLDA